MWFLLVFRLVLPFELHSPTSFFRIIKELDLSTPRQKKQQTAEVIRYESRPTLTRKTNEQENRQPVAPPPQKTTRVSTTLSSQKIPLDSEKEQYAKYTTDNFSTENENIVAVNSLNDLLGILYFFGMISFWGYALFINLRLSKQLENSMDLDEKYYSKILSRAKKRFNITRTIRIQTSEHISTPMWVGLFRPRIILPLNLLGSLSDELLEFIYCHELAHYKRRDLWMSWTILILQGMHWFNPLMWFAFFCMRADRELACDEMVLTKLGQKESQKYGETLISLLRHIRNPRLVSVTIGLSDGHANVKERIFAIARFTPKSHLWFGVLLFAAILIGGLFCTNYYTVPGDINLHVTSNATVKIDSLETNRDNLCDLLREKYDITKNTQFLITIDKNINFRTLFLFYRHLGANNISNIVIKKNGLVPKYYPVEFTHSEGLRWTEDPIIQPVINPRSEIKKFRQNEKWGYKTETGRVLIEPIYDQVSEMFADFTLVKREGRWGAVNFRGDVVIPFRYDSLIFYSDVGTYVKNNKYGLLSRKGQEITTAQWDKVYPSYGNEKSVIVQKDGKWGLLDKKGKTVMAPQLETDFFQFLDEDRLVYNDGSKNVMINDQGERIADMPFNFYSDFYQDFITIEKERKFGLMDKTGNVIIPPIFDRNFWLSNNQGVVKLNGKFGIIDNHGNWILSPLYDGVQIGGQLFAVKVKKKWGFIDSTNMFIIPPRYSKAGYPENNRIVVSKIRSLHLEKCSLYKWPYFRYYDKVGVIDTQGKTIIPIKYDHIKSFETGVTYAIDKKIFGKTDTLYFDLAGNKLKSTGE